MLRLARFLRLVEAVGYWPEALTAGEVVLLPKDGGDAQDPLQRRPIILLPVIYRLWAWPRQSVIERWRASWDPAVRDAPKGADGQAWDLAWDMAVAMAHGTVVAGLAVDFTPLAPSAPSSSSTSLPHPPHNDQAQSRLGKPNHVLDDFPIRALSSNAAMAAVQKQLNLQEAQRAAAASLKAAKTEAKRQASRTRLGQERSKAKATAENSPSRRSTAPGREPQTRGRDKKRVVSPGK